MDDRITKAIHAAITKDIETIVAEEAVLAGKRTEQRVRERTVSIAAQVLNRFSMERFGDNLRIEVRFDAPTKT